MAVQDSYSETMRPAVKGAIVNMEPKVLISRTVEGASVGFGIPVAQGAEDKAARATTTGDTEVLGITVLERSTFDDEFAVGDEARVMTKGVIWTTAVATVAAGDPVHVIVADATFSNTGGVAIPNARFDSSGTAGQLVKVRLA